jgi:microcystin-dependent protein
MSEPFLAEVKIFGFNFPPRGWAFCDGQILPINQNQSLYSLLGTTYGGDGRTSFALPELRGRTPIHVGTGDESTYVLGEKGGEETHVLTTNEIPQHEHEARATSASASSTDPDGNMLAETSGGRFSISPYGDNTSPVALHGSTVANAGSSAGHDNMQPYLALSYCIALTGLFPSRN